MLPASRNDRHHAAPVWLAVVFGAVVKQAVVRLSSNAAETRVAFGTRIVGPWTVVPRALSPGVADRTALRTPLRCFGDGRRPLQFPGHALGAPSFRRGPHPQLGARPQRRRLRPGVVLNRRARPSVPQPRRRSLQARCVLSARRRVRESLSLPRALKRRVQCPGAQQPGAAYHRRVCSRDAGERVQPSAVHQVILTAKTTRGLHCSRRARWTPPPRISDRCSRCSRATSMR